MEEEKVDRSVGSVEHGGKPDSWGKIEDEVKHRGDANGWVKAIFPGVPTCIFFYFSLYTYVVSSTYFLVLLVAGNK